jgi:hypothetical protein
MPNIMALAYHTQIYHTHLAIVFSHTNAAGHPDRHDLRMS